MLSSTSQTNNNSTEIYYCTHSIKRCQQRAVSNWAIEQAILRGEKIYKQGFTFFCLKRKIVINNYEPQLHNQLCDLVVLISEDNTIITAYKDTDAIANIKRKPKRLAKRKNTMTFNQDSKSKRNLFSYNTKIAA
jgi:hypothetical protein